MKEKLQTSVRNLVESTLRSGDLTWEFSSRSRPVEGTRVHRRIQKNRPPEYTREVAVSIQVETDCFFLDVSGRVDGVFTYPDRVIVEEIKSVVFDPAALSGELNPSHLGQARAYAYILAVQRHLETITVRLTYGHVSSGRSRSFDREFSRAELEEFWTGMVERYLSWFGRLTGFRAKRNSSLEKQPFPYQAYRPGQREMAAAIYRTVRDEKRMLVQAPTGIGKTMAAVFPALKALGLGLADKVFYLTARGAGSLAASQALETLRGQGASIKSLVLTAKEKICLNPGRECGPETCEYAQGHFDRIDQALDSFFRIDAFDCDVIRELASRERVCPFELALDLCLWVDVVVCDYNYVFDPRVYLRRFFLESREKFVFLIDEAHNLLDRSREMFSADLKKSEFRELIGELTFDDDAVLPVLERIEGWFSSAEKGGEGFFSEKQKPGDLLILLNEFIEAVETILSRGGIAPGGDVMIGLYGRVGFFLRISEIFDDNYSVCRYSGPDDAKIRLFCLDPAANLKAVLRRGASSVFFSASLSPMSFFKNAFGLDDAAWSLALPSPYSPEKFKVLVMNRISTLYRDRERTRMAVAEAVLTMVRRRQGHYLVFFPSYEYLSLVREILESDFTEGVIQVQTPGMSEDERAAFLAGFSGKPSGWLMGLAVMGGIFGESVDLIGEHLSGAVIIGPGLPGISPENELIRQHFSSLGLNGFEYAYLFPGMNRVLQAAGRVIRSENDRGAALLIDHRFSRPEYKALLPGHWRPEKVGSLSVLESSLREFWYENSVSV